MVIVYIKKFDNGLVFALEATTLVSASLALCTFCNGHEFDNAYRNASVIYVICDIGGHQ